MKNLVFKEEICVTLRIKDGGCNIATDAFIVRSRLHFKSSV